MEEAEVTACGTGYNHMSAPVGWLSVALRLRRFGTGAQEVHLDFHTLCHCTGLSLGILYTRPFA